MATNKPSYFCVCDQSASLPALRDLDFHLLLDNENRAYSYNVVLSENVRRYGALPAIVIYRPSITTEITSQRRYACVSVISFCFARKSCDDGEQEAWKGNIGKEHWWLSLRCNPSFPFQACPSTTVVFSMRDNYRIAISSIPQPEYSRIRTYTFRSIVMLI